MNLFAFNRVLTTKPDGIRVKVSVEFDEFVCGRDQYCVLNVDNPEVECRLYFMPGLHDYHLKMKYAGDHRLVIGGNTTLHGYSEADGRELAELMIEEFLNSVEYRK